MWFCWLFEKKAKKAIYEQKEVLVILDSIRPSFMINFKEIEEGFVEVAVGGD